MARFGDLRIGSKLGLGFGLMGLMFLVLAVSTAISVKALSERVSEVSDSHMPRVQLAHLVTDKLNLAARAVRNAILAHDPAESQRELDRLVEVRKDISSALDKLDATSTSEEARAVLKGVQEARSAYVDAQQRLVTLIRDKKPEEARLFLIGDMRRHQSAYFESLEKLTAFEAAQAHDAAAHAKARAGNTVVLVAVLTVLALAVGATIAFLVTRSIVRPLHDAVAAAQSVAKGDLTARMQARSRDETGQLCSALNDMIAGLSRTVSEVRNGAEQVAAAASELSAASSQVSASSQSQSESAAATASAIEEITVSINAVADSAEELRRLANVSLGQTRTGNDATGQLADEMQRVQSNVDDIAAAVAAFVKSTQTITSMTQQVKDIADQTNLLALNAAIEAARAGEQGRGFAVVADEVRKLAEKSGTSAREIDAVTQSLNEQSERVDQSITSGLHALQVSREHVQTVLGVLADAGRSVESSAKGTDDIAASVREQCTASTDIAHNVERIAQMAEENHAAVNETAHAAGALEGLASRLRTSVDRFRLTA